MIDAHPSDSQLQDFVIGKLADGESATVESHLAACEGCVERAADARSRDTLMELIAAAATRLDAQWSAAVTAAPQDTSVVGTRGWDDLTASDSAESPPSLVEHPRYRLLRKLGAGGMGSVWLAEHLLLDRLVAIKVIRPEFLAKPGAAERFRREARAVARLSHPNIVAAFDAEEAAGTHFLVMEHVEGENLGDVFRRAALPLSEACRAVQDASRGLAHAHARGLVHRDIKPHNLIRSGDGVTKILDFGLATTEAGGIEGLTGENIVLGTPDYIAPEQAQDPHAADARSDVYSLGCTLFALLAGHAPFPGGTVLAKLDAHRHDPPPELPHAPSALAALVRRMMAKRPEERPTATEVEEALTPFCSGTYVDEQVAAVPAKSLRPRWGVALGVLISLAGIFAAAVVVKIQYDHQEITIETDDAANIKVVMRRSGQILRLVDTKTKDTWELDGKKLRLKPDGSELSIDLPGKEPLVIRRNGEKVATVRRTPRNAPSTSEAKMPLHQVRRFVGHTGSVRAVAYSPDGEYVLSGSGWPVGDGTVRLWKVSTGKEVWTIRAPSFVHSVAFCPNDRILIGGNGHVQLHDLKTGDLIRAFDHPAAVHSIAVSPDGRLGLSGADDQTVRVWDLESGVLKRVFRRHAGWIVCVAFSPDERHAASGGGDGFIRVWDVESGKEVKAYRGEKGVIGHVMTFTPNGKQVLFGEDSYLRLWDLESGEVVRSFGPLPQGNGFLSPALSPDGKRVLGAGTDGILRLWDFESGKRLRSFAGHSDMIWGMAFSPDGKLAVSGSGGRIVAGQGRAGDDYSLRLWRLPGLAEAPDPVLPESEPPVAPVAAGPKEVPERPETPASSARRVIDYREIHQATLAELKTWLAALPADFRPTYLACVAGAQPPRFNALAIDDETGAPFDARLDLDGTGPKHVADFNAMVHSGWALRLVCTYVDGDKVLRHHVWIKDGRPWVAWGRDLANLKERLDAWRKEQLRPVTYYLNASDLGRSVPERPYGVLLGPSDDTDWTDHFELSASELQGQLAQAHEDGLRPESLDALGTGDDRTYALTLVPNASRTRWEFATYPTTAQFEAALKQKKADALRPYAVMSDVKDGEVLYRVLWMEYSPSE